jgi:hypothetical protein
MNERIRSIERESGLEIYGLGLDRAKWEAALEKYAELIVSECITIVNEQKECLHEEEKYWHDRDYGYALAVDDASKGIKQFFEVEE